MPSGCAKKTVPRWYEGNTYGFHVTGKGFDVPPKSVVLTDPKADWDTAVYDTKSDDKNLIFTCKLLKIHHTHPTGTLTITITNQDNTTEDIVQDGTYDS
jgi:hypothetical protein